MNLVGAMTHPNIYVRMLPEYENWIYLEEQAALLKNSWSEQFARPQLPLDLEIGCGNGFFFEHLVRSNPNRNHLGIEIKYKPLVQTIRRVKKLELPNGKGIRFHAREIAALFAPGEIDNVYIYFPDPWPKLKQKKHRLIREEFLNQLFLIQKPGRFADVKTDSQDYFDFILSELPKTHYRLDRLTRDLHKSEWAEQNFKTSFEKIFLKQGLPIHYLRLAT